MLVKEEADRGAMGEGGTAEGGRGGSDDGACGSTLMLGLLPEARCGVLAPRGGRAAGADGGTEDTGEDRDIGV